MGHARSADRQGGPRCAAMDDHRTARSGGDWHAAVDAERDARVLQRLLLDQDVRAAGRVDLHLYDSSARVDGGRSACCPGHEQAHRPGVDSVVDWWRGGAVTPDRALYVAITLGFSRFRPRTGNPP